MPSKRRKREVFDAKQVEVEIRKKEAIEEEKLKIVKDIERGIKAQEEVQERIKYAASIPSGTPTKNHRPPQGEGEVLRGCKEGTLEKVARQKLENELDEIARLENCARIQRMHEFHRLQLMQKTQKDDQRFQQIKATRKQLVETRKRNAWESFMRKHHISEAMEQMKITGKFVSLDDIIDPPGRVAGRCRTRRKGRPSGGFKGIKARWARSQRRTFWSSVECAGTRIATPRRRGGGGGGTRGGQVLSLRASRRWREVGALVSWRHRDAGARASAV